jgi:hypothetical protein
METEAEVVAVVTTEMVETETEATEIAASTASTATFAAIHCHLLLPLMLHHQKQN